MVRLRLALCGVVVLTAAVATSVGASAANPQPSGCPTNKPLVVNSYATYENALDYGADGHIWARDAATHYIQIWWLGGDSYCLKLRDVGTSTTFGGLSPEGTGTVRAGVTASFDGVVYARYNATFAPTVPTNGFIGNFDFQCDQEGNCADGVGFHDSFFFSSVHHSDYGSFSFTADAGACGTWHESSSGDTGDIVC